MPVTYEIDKKRRLIVCTVTGICRVEDVLGFRERILADSDFDPNFSQLVDATGIARAEIRPDQARFLAEQSPFSFNARRALVAGNDLGFALLRVYEIVRGLRGDRQVRVFRDRATAIKWLFEEEEDEQAA